MSRIHRPPRLYLAGPDVFQPDARAHGRALQALCAAQGAIGLFPLDNEITGATDLPGAIRDANIAMIASCDALLANMTPFRGPSMDPGTAYEMGVAAALGKIVVGYTDDPRSYVARVRGFCAVTRSETGTLRDPQGMEVEAFGVDLADNLMMARGVHRMAISAAQAIEVAVGLCRAATA